MPMNPEVKALWVAKLREEGLPQTQGALNRVEPYEPAEEDRSFDRPKPVGMCCLGVLCEIAVEHGITERLPDPDDEGRVAYLDHWTDPATGESFEKREIAILPVPVREWAGLHIDNPDVKVPTHTGTPSLALLNDEGYTFPQIADIIEEQF